MTMPFLGSPHDGVEPAEGLPEQSFWWRWNCWTTTSALRLGAPPECLCAALPPLPSPPLRRALPLTLRHGRTNINLPDGRTVFNISRRSKLRTKSFQAQLSVAEGESKRAALIVLADMAKRTMKVINPQNDLVCLIQKPVKTLLLNAAFGAGSELRVDVAPGVDCSALLGVVFGITCMGQSMAKDVFGNFVAEPLTEAAVEEVLDDPGAVLDLAEQGGEALGLDFDAVWEGVGTGLAAAGGCVLELFAGS